MTMRTSGRAITCRGCKTASFATSAWKGKTFGNVPLSCELKLEVWDSPNSAGVVIDAVRCARLALDRGIGGALIGPSSYFMKTPPQQFTDAQAHALVESFIAGEPNVAASGASDASIEGGA